MKMSQRRKLAKKRNNWNRLFTDLFLKDAPLQSFYKSDLPMTNHDNKYQCSECGVKGVKLWRYANSFCISLLCVDCAEKDQDTKCRLNDPDQYRRSDQIGMYLPAVPMADIEYEGYWSYSAIPRSGCIWWSNLPLRLTDKNLALYLKTLQVNDSVTRSFPGFKNEKWFNDGQVISINEKEIICTILVDTYRVMEFDRYTGISILGADYGQLVEREN